MISYECNVPCNFLFIPLKIQKIQKDYLFSRFCNTIFNSETRDVILPKAEACALLIPLVGTHTSLRSLSPHARAQASAGALDSL